GSSSRSGATAVTRKSDLTRVSADARTEHLVKREGATGSLAIVAPGHGPSHPRSLHHGSRLPTMSRRGAASSMMLLRASIAVNRGESRAGADRRSTRGLSSSDGGEQRGA